MIDQPQQPQQQYVPAMGYSTPRDTYGSSIIMLTDPDDDLRRLELTFRSCIEKPDGTFESHGEPLMNNEGITKIMGQIRTIVSRVTILSHLFDKNINLLMEDLLDSLAIDLMLNRKRYDIQNPAARRVIYAESGRTAYICLHRALDGGERKFWKGSQHEVTNRTEVTNQRQGGFLSGLMGWKK